MRSTVTGCYNKLVDIASRDLLPAPLYLVSERFARSPRSSFNDVVYVIVKNVTSTDHVGMLRIDCSGKTCPAHT